MNKSGQRGRKGRLFALVAAVFVLGNFYPVHVVFSSERIESVDEDKDGRKETTIFYEGKTIQKVEIDRNGDNITDDIYIYKNGKRHTGTMDKNYDGKTDVWTYYDPRGLLVRRFKDTNSDGKPDRFEGFVTPGKRDLIIREVDRNYDGKIDKRSQVLWKPDKKIQIYTNGRMTNLPNPGYVSLWREEDNDYDGRIDAEYNKDKKAPSKIGKPIDLLPTDMLAAAAKQPEPVPVGAAGKQGQRKSNEEEHVEAMNRRFGYK